MTVNQLLSTIDSRELSEWRAFFRVEKELRKEEAERNDPKGNHQMNHGLKSNLQGYGK